MGRQKEGTGRVEKDWKELENSWKGLGRVGEEETR